MEKREKLAVIGGSYLQLPLVEKARQMGVETHCFAWADGAVCRQAADHFYDISITEKERILALCREAAVDGVATIASDLAVVTVNHVAAAMGLVANPDQYTDITTNKLRMRACFEAAGVPSPRFRRVTSAAQTVGGLSLPLIVKPADRSGSRGVEKVTEAGALPAAVERALGESFGGEAVVEEYVGGREVSVEAISWRGRHYILAVTDKVTTGAPYFVELEHHQPSTLPADVLEGVRRAALQALAALHVQNGASHTEIKVDPQAGPRVIEVGARMGGDFIGSHLVRLATGYDFLQGVVEVALGRFREPRLPDRNRAGVFFVSAETAHLADIARNPATAAAALGLPPGATVAEAAMTDPDLRPITCSADRSGYIIYQVAAGGIAPF